MVIIIRYPAVAVAQVGFVPPFDKNCWRFTSSGSGSGSGDSDIDIESGSSGGSDDSGKLAIGGNSDCNSRSAGSGTRSGGSSSRS